MQGAGYTNAQNKNNYEQYQQAVYPTGNSYNPNTSSQQQQNPQFSSYNTNYYQQPSYNAETKSEPKPANAAFNPNLIPKPESHSATLNTFDPYQMLGIPNLENNPAAQLGAQFAGNAMNAMQENVGVTMNRMLNLKLLKRYFDVTNGYVLNKVKILTLPWFHKRWYRLVERDTTGQPVGFKSPREDNNSNDLYIPLMALITYITLIGIISGANGTFHPSYLGSTGSKALAIVVFEVLIMKLVCYLLNVGSELVLLDMISLSGYKFLMVIPPVLSKLGGGRMVVWAVYLYFALALVFFMTRSLRIAVIPEASQLTGTNTHLPMVLYPVKHDS
ncbi:hypothetical protein BB561_003158 [Smittium simulii]|uniref:Protein YIF1 n=1 Tax=Smittium simulii TaxID=133385 RepID=A0A2T9YMN8_9FUNG|nr:hypothetical protein BB561_003158 [Smittium simulii]